MILVIGATGMFGSRVAREAARRGAEVRGVVHSPDKAGILKADGIEPVVADLDDARSLAPALDGVERVFLVTPMDERIADRERGVIAAARAAGVQHIVKLHGAVQHGADRLGQQHLESIEALKASGMAWTLLCPQSVMETNLLGQAEAVKQTGALWGSAGEGRVGMVAADDCGRAGGIVLTTDGHDGREYFITGPTALSFRAIAEEISNVLQRPVSYNDLSDDDFKAMLVEQAGMSEHEAEIGVILHFQAFRRGDAELVTDDYERLTGEPPTTLGDWLVAHIDSFR